MADKIYQEEAACSDEKMEGASGGRSTDRPAEIAHDPADKSTGSLRFGENNADGIYTQSGSIDHYHNISR